MENYLYLFVLIPVAGFLLTFLMPGNKEGIISRVTFISVGIHLLVATIFVAGWLWNGHPSSDHKILTVISSEHYEFFVDFCFDKITAVYLIVGSFLTFLVTTYCRYYLHRESGYKRFFLTVQFFFIGYNITIFSGNLETLFIGWEILGISSFLLIAFYRDRYLPVKNAIKVFSIYRVGDVGIILAMWMAHHLFHGNITFFQLQNEMFVNQHLETHSVIGIFISLMILVSAAAKSAQLPFSSWLPRAMEGPTPSSAIFYGSLSVHIGAFLLLRTFPFWEHQTSVRVVIAILGLSTSIITTLIARVQSSIKSQIAYSSIAQIGLIFIEISMGWDDLALIHFAGNAFLRTYQLLVSPSVVSYLIKEQFYNFTPRALTIEDTWPKRIEYSIYLLSLKEWNLDNIMHKIVWSPMNKVGNYLGFISVKQVLLFFIPAYLLGVYCLFNEELIPLIVHQYLPSIFAIIGLLMVTKAFVERSNVMMSWLLIIMNHFWITLAVSFNEHFTYDHTLLYLSGIVLGGAIGYLCLARLKKFENKLDLNRFNGHSYEHPKIALVFLFACLSLTGFPITPTFVGEDLIFSHIHENQIGLAIFISMSFITDGLAIIRIYGRIFMGPHVKTYHEVPYKSS